jgi:hypothetical protein
LASVQAHSVLVQIQIVTARAPAVIFPPASRVAVLASTVLVLVSHVPPLHREAIHIMHVPLLGLVVLVVV